tara:strand:- start:137 stop:322 length:186 start_codon:yes stop_codon:yes gene_type:complete
MSDGKIIDLGKVRFSRVLAEAFKFMEMPFTPAHILINGVHYYWTEKGYLSNDGYYLQLEDL